MIDDLVASYLTIFPGERPALSGLLGQLQANEIMHDRKNFNGHITGGAFVLSPDMSQLLVIYHKLFDKWLQPGGHWEVEDEGPWQAAAREATEETGVRIARQLPAFDTDLRVPFSIHSHPIKNRPHKKEPAHQHHDFKYLFVAADDQLHNKAREVNINQVAWMGLDDPRLAALHSDGTLPKLKQLISQL